MNNNVFIYLPISKKKRQISCEDLFKTEIFASVCLIQSFVSGHLEDALVLIKRLDSSRGNKVDRGRHCLVRVDSRTRIHDSTVAQN